MEQSSFFSLALTGSRWALSCFHTSASDGGAIGNERVLNGDDKLTMISQ